MTKNFIYNFYKTTKIKLQSWSMKEDFETQMNWKCCISISKKRMKYPDISTYFDHEIVHISKREIMC